jgi:hypothetical protein
MSRTESGPLSIFHDQKAMHALSIFHDWLENKSERNLEASKLRRVISEKVETQNRKKDKADPDREEALLSPSSNI